LNFFFLKEAARISGYTPDYIGYLIRRKKIFGKKTYSGSKWFVLKKDLIEYLLEKRKLKPGEKSEKLSLGEKKYISLKEAARISGYSPDHIGYLIREDKVSGKQVFFGAKWTTTQKAIEDYSELKRRKKSFFAVLAFYFEKVFEVFVALSLKATKYGMFLLFFRADYFWRVHGLGTCSEKVRLRPLRFILLKFKEVGKIKKMHWAYPG